MTYYYILFGALGVFVGNFLFNPAASDLNGRFMVGLIAAGLYFVVMMLLYWLDVFGQTGVE